MGYIFKQQEYTNIFTLAKIIYQNIDEFDNLLRSDDSLLEFIKNEDEEKYNKISKLLLLTYPVDVLIFQVSYILNPYMPFRIRNKEFSSYQELGKKMLFSSPNVDPLLFQIVQYNLISFHMEASSYNLNNNKIYEEVKEIERLSDKQYAYFKLAYYLSKEDIIIFDGKEYQDIYNFCYFIIKKSKDLNSLGNSLSNASFLNAYKDYSKNSKKISEYLHICLELEKNERKLNEFLQKKG